MAPEVYGRGPGSVIGHPLRRLLALAVPAPCLGCGRPLAGSAVALSLCAMCRGRLRPIDPAAACAVCSRPLAGRLPRHFRCARCRSAPPFYERLLARWRYEPPFSAVIAGLKFRRLGYLGRHLGEELAEAFAAELADRDLVVPIPLPWYRRLLRGYNQAEEIARPLAERLGLPMVPALRRRGLHPAQRTLRRAARLSNLSGAIAVRPGVDLAARRVLLVDDVATTGATLDAAARALRQAGAASVVAIVAGRTPSRDDRSGERPAGDDRSGERQASESSARDGSEVR